MNKKIILASIIITFGLLTISCAGEFAYNEKGLLEFNIRNLSIIRGEVETSSLAGGFIGLVVGGVLAMKIAPIFFNATTTLETDVNDDLTSDEESLVSILPYMLIFGIIGMVVGGIAI